MACNYLDSLALSCILSFLFWYFPPWFVLHWVLYHYLNTSYYSTLSSFVLLILEMPVYPPLPDKLLIFQYLAQISHSLLPYPTFSGNLSFLSLFWSYLKYTFNIALRTLHLNANNNSGINKVEPNRKSPFMVSWLEV